MQPACAVVMALPELQEAICRFLDRKSLLRLSLTNRTIQRALTPQLGSTLDLSDVSKAQRLLESTEGQEALLRNMDRIRCLWLRTLFLIYFVDSIAGHYTESNEPSRRRVRYSGLGFVPLVPREVLEDLEDAVEVPQNPDTPEDPDAPWDMLEGPEDAESTQATEAPETPVATAPLGIEGFGSAPGWLTEISLFNPLPVVLPQMTQLTRLEYDYNMESIRSQTPARHGFRQLPDTAYLSWIIMLNPALTYIRHCNFTLQTSLDVRLFARALSGLRWLEHQKLYFYLYDLPWEDVLEALLYSLLSSIKTLEIYAILCKGRHSGAPFDGLSGDLTRN
ncbi:hypothetical protein BGX33_000311 [Mortierella sp. NVP41]|nr:hypothetical protein BGX33_000311 [Mortierella sp. NVP41]